MQVIRTPDHRLRVFISSTLTELSAERTAARSAVAHLHLTPVLFELGARAHPPRDLYRAYLEQSHVFIGIYWQEYGWIAPDESLSGIEDEYRLAQEMPKLVYVREPSPERDPRLVELLERISADRVSYRPFENADELGRFIEEDLALLLSERFEDVERGHPAPTGVAQAMIPADLTGFIGREDELRAIERSVEGSRLVTLTGPGGIGKTRLALQVAKDMAGRFSDGIAAVMLAAVRDVELVPVTIANQLGVPDAAGRSPLEAMSAHLKDREMLLVLDNFEQITEAAGVVAELLAATRRLKIIVTSREVLHLTAERVHPVPPLAVPEEGDPLEGLGDSEAVQLFVERASAVRRDMVLDSADLEIVAEMARRLDGLPLAIELAAAQARLFPPPEILRRLDRRLGVLTGGPRDAPERQRTLRSTIEWSYELLLPEERRSFAMLGVFSGSFSLEAAEAVCPDAIEVLDHVGSLVDKSLLRSEGPIGGNPRFSMLQTVREYALDRVRENGELETLTRRHADFYLGWARTLERGFQTAEEMRLAAVCGANNDNLRAALRWAMDNDRAGDVALAGEGLWQFWWIRSLFVEGMAWMQEAIGSTLSERERASACWALGMLAFGYGDYQRAAPALATAAQLFAEAGRPKHAIIASIPLGVITAVVDLDKGLGILEAGVERIRVFDDDWAKSFASFGLGRGMLLQGRVTEAVSLLEESVDSARATGTQVMTSFALLNLGWSYLGLPDVDRADATFLEAFDRAAQLQNREAMARAFDALTAIALERGDPERACVLFGAGEGLRRSIGATVWVTDRLMHEGLVNRLREALGDSYDATLARGAQLPIGAMGDLAHARGDSIALGAF